MITITKVIKIQTAYQKYIILDLLCGINDKLKMRKKKGQLISERIKIPLVAAFGSPLVKALDKSVETLGL